MTECTCTHEKELARTGVAPPPLPEVGLSPASPTDPLRDAVLALAANVTKLTALHDDVLASGSSCSTLRTVQMLDCEKGSEVALEDLPRWLTEFNRVVDHVSGGRGLPAKDRIVRLHAAWTPDLPGDAGRAGEDIRLDRDTAEYKRLEAAADFERCWSILIRTLERRATPPANARRKAQALWSSLAWPQEGGIKAFHLKSRQAFMACERNHVPKADHDVVLRYME